MAYIQLCSFDLFASNKSDPKVFWIMMMIHAVLCFWAPVSIFMFFICTSPHTCVCVCLLCVCVSGCMLNPRLNAVPGTFPNRNSFTCPNQQMSWIRKGVRGTEGGGV